MLRHLVCAWETSWESWLAPHSGWLPPKWIAKLVYISDDDWVYDRYNIANNYGL